MTVIKLEQAGASPWGYPLLQDINLDLAAGSVMAVIGPNGAGKSSLLQLMAGGMIAESGSITLGDTALQLWPATQKARAVALLPQYSSLSFPYTVEEVIRLGRIPHQSGAQQDLGILQEVMQLTDTLSLGQRLYTQLSGGERQRVQLARVIAQLWRQQDSPTRLLLLDEPNTALDPAHQRMVLNVIRHMAGGGCAVALVMHDFNLVAAVADKILVLDRGRCVAQGTPDSVLTQAMFADVFKVDVHIEKHRSSGHPLVFYS
jgi:iron complex transport system ATP-binding protein